MVVFAHVHFDVYAQTGSQFEVSLGVTGPADPFPPSQPTSLTATPVSQTQIDLAWASSTDNVSIAGYVVYRDTVAIATTTSTIYVDPSLVASTMYTYSVQAFDPSLNYSVMSASVSTTTLPVVVVPPVATDSTTVQGSLSSVEILDLEVNPGITSAFVSFRTRGATLAKIFWGTSPDFEIGSISGVEYTRDHTFKLDGLVAGTVYYFKVSVVNGVGAGAALLSSFTTLTTPREVEVANPQNFTARYVDTSVRLSWINPSVFDSLVIVRSDKFFPVDLLDGKTVYEGRGTSSIDSDVVAGKTYYYTIFAKDVTGRLSSGAIASVAIPTAGGQIVVTNPFDYLAPANNNDPLLQDFTIFDVDFYQDGRKLPMVDGVVYMDGTKDLVVGVEYDKLPEVLKTIAVSIYDSKDTSESFSFLLRINKDKSAYRATVASLQKEGKFPVSVVVVDYKDRSMKKVNGSLISSLLQNVEIKNQSVVWFWSLILAILFFIFLLYVLIKILQRTQKQNTKK